MRDVTLLEQTLTDFSFFVPIFSFLFLLSKTRITSDNVPSPLDKLHNMNGRDSETQCSREERLHRGSKVCFNKATPIFSLHGQGIIISLSSTFRKKVKQNNYSNWYYPHHQHNIISTAAGSLQLATPLSTFNHPECNTNCIT